MPDLLTRDTFRFQVFDRDGHRCVLCRKTAQDTPEGKLDAHHIIERRLWGNGGYYVDNGATVCEACHLLCEQTLVSVEEVRQAAGITSPLVPDHLYAEDTIDKWGNTVLPNGTRLRGELFFDESVQKVLAPVMHLFSDKVKYPRSHHLPWSPGLTDDDRVQHDLSCFEGKEVVVTLKMDGENTSLYSDAVHARSLEYVSRIDRDRVKQLQANTGYNIPPNWRVCGENMWGQHTIRYEELPHFFFTFSIWDERNVCLSWDETVEYAALLDLPVVPVLWRGTWDEAFMRSFKATPHYGEEAEGYVVRLADSFAFRDFRRSLLKWVRKDHVRTQAHWTRRIVPNGFLPGVL